MAQRAGGCAWLAAGSFFAVIAVGLIAFGGYAVMYTHQNVRIHDDILARDQQELRELMPVAHLPKNNAKFQDLHRRINADELALYDYRQSHYIAIAILASSLFPAALTVLFLAIFFYKWSKSGVTSDVEPPTTPTQKKARRAKETRERAADDDA